MPTPPNFYFWVGWFLTNRRQGIKKSTGSASFAAADLELCTGVCKQKTVYSYKNPNSTSLPNISVKFLVQWKTDKICLKAVHLFWGRMDRVMQLFSYCSRRFLRKMLSQILACDSPLGQYLQEKGKKNRYCKLHVPTCTCTVWELSIQLKSQDGEQLKPSCEFSCSAGWKIKHKP